METYEDKERLINSGFYDLLIAYQFVRPERYRSDGEFADLVFVTSMGLPVLRYHAEKECKKVVQTINEAKAFDSAKEQRKLIIFEDVYPHAIRHTFCSRCFEKGINPKVVQTWMGHQHYSTTIEIYTHVTEQMFGDEVAKFGSAITLVETIQ